MNIPPIPWLRYRHCDVKSSFGRELEQRGFVMTTNFDFGRSSLVAEQYHREMEPITAALQEESQEERDERLSLVEHSWPLSCSCFYAELESSDQPIYTSLVSVGP